MAYLRVHRRYRDLVEHLGLTEPEQFLDLPAEIICGHPGRHVGCLTLGTPSDQLLVYLKREHRVSWRDRWLNALAGFGPVSKADREAQTLDLLHRAGIGCPEWIAVGLDRRGRAFLLLRALSESHDLRIQLQSLSPGTNSARRRLAQRLGQSVARLHNAGFDQPDLYAKHVVISSDRARIWFLDWQRTRRRNRVSCRRRFGDLAALDATLADNLVSSHERLLFLHAYQRECGLGGHAFTLRTAVSSIRRLSGRLLRQRRIREQRDSVLSFGEQRLMWMDGEALCLTKECQQLFCGRIPDWLRLANLPPTPPDLHLVSSVALPEGRRGVIVQRRRRRAFGRGWRPWRRRGLCSSEVRLAGLLFRLQRSGVPVPRPLAFGHREGANGCVESFLLTQSSPDSLTLKSFFEQTPPTDDASRRLFLEAGRLMRSVEQGASS